MSRTTVVDRMMPFKMADHISLNFAVHVSSKIVGYAELNNDIELFTN